MIHVTGRHHPSPRNTGKPSTSLVRLDVARQHRNAVAFIRPAGQPPWIPRVPAAGAPPPQAPRPLSTHIQALPATVRLNPRCATSSSRLPDKKQPPEDSKPYVFVLTLCSGSPQATLG